MKATDSLFQSELTHGAEFEPHEYGAGSDYEIQEPFENASRAGS